MIKLVYVIRKRADVSAEEFHRYWLKQHGPLVASLAKAIHARKYVQSHTILPDAAKSVSASRQMAAPYDGITEVWWDSLEEMSAGSSTPEGQEAGRTLLQDESKFIDFAKSTIFFTEEHLIFDFQASR